MKNTKIWIALGALVLVAALMVGIFVMTRPEPQEGGKTITVAVVHKDGVVKKFVYQTEETHLAPLLVGQGLIPEGDIQSGMFYTVDGEKADWMTDEGWWAVYKDYAQINVGIEEQVIVDGDTFMLVYTNGFAI